MKPKWNRFFGSLILALSYAAAAMGADAGWQTRWETTLAAAKKEGKLNFYGTITPPVRSALTKAFTAKYGLEIEFVIGSPAEVAQKYSTEYGVGQHNADLLNAGPTTLISLKPKGLTEPAEPFFILPEVKDANAWRGDGPFVDQDKQIIHLVATYIFYVLRNTEQVKEAEITSFRDLLQPKWKGKMVMNDPTVPGTGLSWVALLVKLWGEEETVKFLKQLAAQEPVLSRDRRQPVEWVARGKYPIAVAPNIDNVAQFLKIGSPVLPVKTKEGGALQTGGAALAMTKNPPHPNARVVFLNWLLSKEGMTVFSSAYGHPSARLDVPAQEVHPIFLAKPEDKVISESEEHYLLQIKMLPVVKGIFAGQQ